MVAKIPGRKYTDNSDNRYDLDEVLEKMWYILYSCTIDWFNKRFNKFG